MGWLQIIIFVVTNLPKIISLVKEIIKMINELGGDEKKAATVELASELKRYRRCGDRRGLRNLLERLRD